MKKIREIMSRSISEVFEKMFFLFLEPLDDEDITYDMEAAIGFKGSMSGEVRVLLSRDMAKTMVHNMLGLAEDETVTQRIEDCSKEAVNMVCGAFLCNLDRTRVFDLAVPVFRERPGDLELVIHACRMDFDSGGKRVGVIIEID